MAAMIISCVLCCCFCSISIIWPLYSFFLKKPAKGNILPEIMSEEAAPFVSCLRGNVFDADYVTVNYQYDMCDFAKFAQWRCFNQDGNGAYDSIWDTAAQLGYDCGASQTAYGNGNVDDANVCATLKAGNWSPESLGCTVKEPSGAITKKNLIQKATNSCIDCGGNNNGIVLKSCANDNTWQQWSLLPNGILSNSQNFNCMDAGNIGTLASICDPSNKNHVWSYNKYGQIVNSNGKCLDVVNNAWTMSTCNPGTSSQIFKLGDSKLY